MCVRSCCCSSSSSPAGSLYTRSHFFPDWYVIPLSVLFGNTRIRICSPSHEVQRQRHYMICNDMDRTDEMTVVCFVSWHSPYSAILVCELLEMSGRSSESMSGPIWCQREAVSAALFNKRMEQRAVPLLRIAVQASDPTLVSDWILRHGHQHSHIGFHISAEFDVFSATRSGIRGWAESGTCAAGCQFTRV